MKGYDPSPGGGGGDLIGSLASSRGLVRGGNEPDVGIGGLRPPEAFVGTGRFGVFRAWRNSKSLLRPPLPSDVEEDEESIGGGPDRRTRDLQEGAAAA